MAKSTPQYHINIFYSADDECWIADVPDLRYCSASGDSATEAVDEVQVAIQAYLESCEMADDPIPEPRYNPLIYRLAV